MVRPVVGALAEEMYAGLGPLADEDGEGTGWIALHLCEAWTRATGTVATIVRDSDDGPGWSMVLDVDRVPDDLIPWLGQWVGVRIAAGVDPTLARTRVRDTPGFRRGRPDAIIAAVTPFLTGSRTVRLAERDTSPYHFTVRVYDPETPADPTPIIEAIQAAKPIGLTFTFAIMAGPTWDEVVGTWDAQTLTWDAMEELIP